MILIYKYNWIHGLDQEDFGLYSYFVILFSKPIFETILNPQFLDLKMVSKDGGRHII